MDFSKIYSVALNSGQISAEDGIALYKHAPTEELIFVANKIRQQMNPGNEAGWMVDRNVNITNVCFSQCSFCNFCRKEDSEDAYITSINEYKSKIDELYSLGG